MSEDEWGEELEGLCSRDWPQQYLAYLRKA